MSMLSTSGPLPRAFWWPDSSCPCPCPFRSLRTWLAPLGRSPRLFGRARHKLRGPWREALIPTPSSRSSWRLGRSCRIGRRSALSRSSRAWSPSSRSSGCARRAMVSRTASRCCIAHCSTLPSVKTRWRTTSRMRFGIRVARVKSTMPIRRTRLMLWCVTVLQAERMAASAHRRKRRSTCRHPIATACHAAVGEALVLCDRSATFKPVVLPAQQIVLAQSKMTRAIASTLGFFVFFVTVCRALHVLLCLFIVRVSRTMPSSPCSREGMAVVRHIQQGRF
mmetsp:Transcript_87982/g.223986  ORF Transcript_87982/g.223986 Transcript_87982/m.223986 type:complete len:279 (+) Transcript_87982:325-1161(+)